MALPVCQMSSQVDTLWHGFGEKEVSIEVGIVGKNEREMEGKNVDNETGSLISSAISARRSLILFAYPGSRYPNIDFGLFRN